MGSIDATRTTLKLRDVIDQIEHFDDELTIYAVPDWTPESPAIVDREPEGGGLPPAAVSAGMRYFLEVFIVKEVLEGLGQLDLDGRTKRLIRYATTDA